MSISVPCQIEILDAKRRKMQKDQKTLEKRLNNLSNRIYKVIDELQVLRGYKMEKSEANKIKKKARKIKAKGETTLTNEEADEKV